MSLSKKNKLLVSVVMISFLIGTNVSGVCALNFNKFKNIGIEMPAVIAIEENSGDVLYAQNESVQRPIASLTKSMTLLLALDAIKSGNLDPDEIIEVKEDPDSWGSSYYLKKGDKYTVKDYLQMIMIISANDACIVMANRISGTVDKFVELMNERAKELGMTDTVFLNPNGLPIIEGDDHNPGNLSTAKDLAILAKYIMNVYGEDVLKLVSSKKINIKNSEDARFNSNKLLFRQDTFEGYIVDGFKTGFTDEAGFCLITTSNHDNGTPDDIADDYRVIGVSLGGTTSEHRFNEHTKLLNHVQDTYENKKILNKSEIVDTLDEYNTEKYKVNLVPQNDVYALVKKGSKIEFDKELFINKDISYPICKGDTMGVVKLINKENPDLKYSVNLISSNDTKEVSFFDRVFRRVR